MGKRFTETLKWDDKWYRRLPPEQKLAWDYICCKCDPAGVIDLDRELAEFQIGCEVDWDSFFLQCAERLERLERGKLWIVSFCDFQYGKLSSDCRAHIPVISSLKKYGLWDSYCKGYSKAIDSHKEQEQEKEKEQEKEQERDKDKKGVQGETKQDWIVPERLDTPQVRQQLHDFQQMRKKIGKPIKDIRNSSRILDSFDDVEHLLYAINYCIGNEYQGLKPEYRPSTSANNGRMPVTFAQARLNNSAQAVQRFLANDNF